MNLERVDLFVVSTIHLTVTDCLTLETGSLHLLQGINACFVARTQYGFLFWLGDEGPLLDDPSAWNTTGLSPALLDILRHVHCIAKRSVYLLLDGGAKPCDELKSYDHTVSVTHRRSRPHTPPQSVPFTQAELGFLWLLVAAEDDFEDESKHLQMEMPPALREKLRHYARGRELLSPNVGTDPSRPASPSNNPKALDASERGDTPGRFSSRELPMTRRYFDCTRESRPVRVTLGYDRPLHEFFLHVEFRPREGEDTAVEDDPYLYLSVDDPTAPTDSLEFFRAKLLAFGIRVPESMFLALAQDAEHRVGNLIAEHFADGRIMLRHSDS